jgi:hypothetical protein
MAGRIVGARLPLGLQDYLQHPSVALEGGNRSILLRKADIGDGRHHVSFVPGADLLSVIWT